MKTQAHSRTPSRAALSSGFTPSRAKSPPPAPALPVLLNEALQTPGQALDGQTGSFMGQRFGHDFSPVRVHTGERPARAARALSARAFTLGEHLVFGESEYAPRTATGRSLLAHELAHVVQTDGQQPGAGPLTLAAVNDPAEREADAAAAAVESQSTTALPGACAAREGHAGTVDQPRESAAKARRPGRLRGGGAVSGGRTVYRSFLGGILGAIGGALGGALLGGLIGGPIGAIIGGVVGLVGGGLIADKATTRSRPLTGPEVKYAKDIFKDSIDYSQITITRDSMLSAGAPRTIGNTIHLRSDWGHFKDNTMELTPRGLETLIHEMGHVWQYQNGGLAYIPESLWAQFKAWVKGKSRNAAYDWRAAHAAGLPWEKWNPEQQAEAIEDYNKLLRKSKDGTATVAELAELSTLVPYMQNVWQRQGAPHFETPDLKDAPI